MVVEDIQTLLLAHKIYFDLISDHTQVEDTRCIGTVHTCTCTVWYYHWLDSSPFKVQYTAYSLLLSGVSSDIHSWMVLGVPGLRYQCI